VKAPEPCAAAPLLSFRQVSRSYARGDERVSALSDVSLELFPGEFVAVCGPSGSGKTTLLNIAALADVPSAGEVLFEGGAFVPGDSAARRRTRAVRVGFVFQFFNLLPSLTALENVMLPLLISNVTPRAAEKRAREALVELGLGARLDHYPHQISGGEMQRAAIARAIVHDPSVIVADEPTGSLDTAAGEAVVNTLSGFASRGKLVLIATHSEALAARCSRRIVLHDGRLVDDTGAA
jgi:putative ABC transport system ATP-binding protein